MYKNTNTIKILGAIMVILFAFFVLYIISASALAYVPLEPTLVGSSQDEPVDAGSYIKKIYQIGIGIAGVLAVLMIVIGGIEYIASAANPTLKGAAKTRIWAAIGGLILALFSYIILNTINPKLVNFDLSLKKVNIKVKTIDKEPKLPPSAVKSTDQIEKNAICAKLCKYVEEDCKNNGGKNCGTEKTNCLADCR